MGYHTVYPFRRPWEHWELLELPRSSGRSWQWIQHGSIYYVGVSENSVPLHPMVLLIIIPIKWLFHWEYTLFSDKPMCIYI